MPPRDGSARRRAHRRGRARPGARCAWSSSSASTTARSCRGCAGSTAACRRSPGRTRCCCARRCRRTARTCTTRRRRSTVARGRARRRSCSPGTRRTSGRPARSTPRARVDDTDALVARLVASAARTTGDVARGRRALADHAQGAHLRARPAASSPRRRRRCPSSSAACATGTTATAGCATRRFTLYALIARRLPRRGARLARLAAARGRRATRRSCRSCTAPAGERRLHRARAATGCRATRARAPVRIGNAAVEPVPARRLRRGDGRAATRRAQPGSSRDEDAWQLADARCSSSSKTAWREPDEGIWEVRGPRRHFTHSKVMAWVAFDRAVKTVEQLRPARARSSAGAALRDEIHAEVCERGFDAERNAFTQSYGSRGARREPAADPARSASCRADDPRVRRHRRRRSSASCCGDGFVLRYPTDESRSTACRRARARSCRARSGSSTRSRCRAGATRPSTLFERLLGLRNDVGLLAEEYDPRRRPAARQLPAGVLPLALVNSALLLSREPSSATPAQQRAQA